MARKNKRVKHYTGGRAKNKQSRVPSGVYAGQNIMREALGHHRAGRVARAEALYRQILRSEPDHPEALLHLGVLASQVGKYGAAEELINRAADRRPDYVEAHYNLGIVLLIQGKTDKAITAFRRVLTLNPDHTEAHNNLGNALAAQGRPAEAAASYQQAVSLKPDYAEAHYNLGNVLDDLGRYKEAAASYQQAIILKPDYVDAHYNLGLLFQGQGKSDEAVASYRRVITLKPDYAAAHNNLGIILKDRGKLDEAVAGFRCALKLRPDYLEAYSNLLFCLNYLPGQSIEGYLEAARHYGNQAAARVTKPYTDWLCSSQPKHLRVGLVSDDFRNHPVGYFLENMLANVDPSRIELIAYPTNRFEDELTGRIRPRFASWKPLAGMDDKYAARLIHKDAVHILLDLSGHTRHNRLPVFAWKPAPIQATWLGYIASTGLAQMDYIIGDPVSIPESHRDHFTEKVWYLPETRVCFSPPALDEELAVAPPPALCNGFITFGSFQNLAKLNDTVLDLWVEILQQLPQARLRLQNSHFDSTAVQEEMQKQFSGRGIAPERLILEKSVPRREYLAVHAQIDIILDTFPFSGGTTTCESLWMGVPTVTLAGKTMVGRQGASLLACAGLNDWIAADPKEYAAIALGQTADLDKLARLRSGLRQQVLGSPIFDGSGFARCLEAAFWGMWHDLEENLNSSSLK